MHIDNYESDYASLVKDILDNGVERQTRNAVTKSVFGRTLRINMAKNQFPILAGRKMFYKGVIGELAAMLQGPKSIEDFRKYDCNYWDKFAKPDGSIEVDYGNAWIDFNGVNQLKELVEGIKRDPHGRRHIVTGWRPDRLSQLSLPCCHLLYQWYVRDGLLDMIWYQRSVDTMIGLPSDVIVAYVWNLLVANETGYEPGEIIMMLGDTHIYNAHIQNAVEYVRRVRAMPEPILTTHKPFAGTMTDFDPAGFIVEDYQPLSKIDFELFV